MCQERCLCTEDDCKCTRGEDLLSGKSSKSTQQWDKDTHTRELQTYSEEKLKAVVNQDQEYHEPHQVYSRRIKETKSNIKTLGGRCKSFSSYFNPQSSAKYSSERQTPMKSLSAPEDIAAYIFDSYKCMDQSSTQKKAADLIVSTVSKGSSSNSREENTDSCCTYISTEVESSSEIKDYSVDSGNEGACEYTPRNLSANKLEILEVTPDFSFSQDVSNIEKLQLSYVKSKRSSDPKYKLGVKNKISSSNESSPFSSDVSQSSSPQSSRRNPKYVPKFDLSQKHFSDTDSANSQPELSSMSEYPVDPMKSFEDCQHGLSNCKSCSSTNIVYKRCKPIIIPHDTNIDSNPFDFSLLSSPKRPSSADSYFDRELPCPVLRSSGYIDEIYKMNRCVLQSVLSPEEIRDKLQRIPRSTEQEAQDFPKQDSSSMTIDPERSSSKTEPQIGEIDKEKGEVLTISNLIQEDAEIADSILTRFPHDPMGHEANESKN